MFFYWSQLEPEPGRYDWTAVDAFPRQTDADTELRIMIGASSPLATARSTDFLPASPRLELRAYARMISSLVQHCNGRFGGGSAKTNRATRGSGEAPLPSTSPSSMRSPARCEAPTETLGSCWEGCPPGVFPADEEDSQERRFFTRSQQPQERGERAATVGRAARMRRPPRRAVIRRLCRSPSTPILIAKM